jgi:hypothetical protein
MPPDLDGTEAAFAAQGGTGTDGPTPAPGGVKARFAHFIGRRNRPGDLAAEMPAPAVGVGIDRDPPGITSPAPRERASLADAVSALSDEVRRLTVELGLAAFKAETQAWRRKAVEAELGRAHQALAVERAAAAAAAVEQENLRHRYEVEIGRLTMDLSLARIRADGDTGKLLAAQARIAHLEAAGHSATSRIRALEATHRIDLEAAELRIQALAAELDAVRPLLASLDRGVSQTPRDPAPAELPGVFGGGGWRSAPPRHDQAGLSTAPPLSAQSLNPPMLKTLP